ncbi:TPA: ERCC4-type nuclease [Clostridium perfringens]|uniref:ERCC4-type nuclease n=1 Tax=Clostridium perfringens TaxID=1502 RepID=A0A8H9UXW8_CLOPF|nr:ERCC4-type nuclease [Clostridium perfringens]
MRYKFTEKEVKEILKKIVVLVDTREQANKHILEFFDKKKIKWKSQKLDYGDYSCMLPAGSFEGQTRDIYFTNDTVVERKFCIDELAMNLKDQKTNLNEIKKETIEILGEEYLKKVLKCDYNRLKFELANMNRYQIEFFIFLEDENYDENIRHGKFRAKYDPATLYARLKALEREFKTVIRPTAEDKMGSEIYNTLKYGVRNVLIHKGLCADMSFEEMEAI